MILITKLLKSQQISFSDEHWLDQEVNTVDEQYILDLLEATEDYKKELGRFDGHLKGIVEKLLEWWIKWHVKSANIVKIKEQVSE